MSINASCSEASEAGKFLLMVLGRSPVLGVLWMKEYIYAPFEARRHTLVLKIEPHDVRAFADLIDETHGTERGCAEFITHVRNRLN